LLRRFASRNDGVNVTAHRHDVVGHRNAMILLYCGALVIAGLFTFYPGRIKHAVLWFLMNRSFVDRR
jgi:uncharacterized membrane protein